MTSRSADPLGALGAAIEAEGGLRPGAFAIAVSLHMAFALVIPRRVDPVRTEAPSVLVVDVEAPPPVHEELLQPAPPAETGKSSTPKRDIAPSPAQAAKILARDDHTADPLDLTGDFVAGNAAYYAGGTTSATGTSKRVVREASAAGPPAGSSSGQAAGESNAADLSRHASMEGGSTWQCPFPTEAGDINDASVTMRVEVDATGHVRHASVVRDPGHGFGREAARCVYEKHWTAALDRRGAPVATTAVVVVRFVR